MKDKKLLIFSYDYPPSDGGIARLCQEIASGMSSFYESVTVLTRKKVGQSIPYNYHKVNVVQLPSTRLLGELAALWFLLTLKERKRYTVLCGLWHPEAALALLAGYKNIFVLGHGTEFLSGKSSFRKNFWLPIYCKWVLKNVKNTIANSHYTQKLILDINSNSNSNCEVSPLGVNHNFFKPKDRIKENEKLQLCTVSRIQQFKGHDFVLKTLAQLPVEFKTKIEWHIAGTGSYLSPLKEMVVDLGLSDQVFFHGFVKDEFLPEFYSQADVFVLCTREEQESTSVEGFGLVFLEAQACGVPVIGTNTGGIPDAIEKENGGWLIEQDNEDELTDLLMILLTDKSIAESMGEKARKRVEQKGTWEHYCKKLNEIIK